MRPGLAGSPTSSHAAAFDAVVFAPAMAAPPSYAAIALEHTTAPLVIWNAPTVTRLEDGLTQAAATEHTTTVGALMYGNVRVREGRPPLVVTAGHGDRAGSTACCARSAPPPLRDRCGERPCCGSVTPSPATSTSKRRRPILRPLACARSRSTSRPGRRPWTRQTRLTPRPCSPTCGAGGRGTPGTQAERSARVAVALDAALAGTGAVAGTVNCHGPWFRGSDRVGITACLAVACQAEQGRSIACTGDMPTAIVLHLARLVAGSALYCEGYTPEADTGLLLVAAGGEGDPAWADPPGAVTLEANDHYPGVHGKGTGLSFGLRRGPATLMSLSPTAAGWRLAWATGEIVESRYDDMRGPNGMFRFDSGPAVEAIDGWIASGATHHNALAPGRLDVEIPALASALSMHSVRI